MDGSTGVPGLYVVGDLTGIPLLKLAADTGARAVRTIAAHPSFVKREQRAGAAVHDLVIVGAGVSGMSAALEAQKLNLDFVILEASEPFSTIVNFPKRKPIYTYPTAMVPSGDLQAHREAEGAPPRGAAATGDGLGDRAEGRACRSRAARSGTFSKCCLRRRRDASSHRVIVAIGRSGDFRKLGVPGRRRTRSATGSTIPKDFAGTRRARRRRRRLALESAIAIAEAGDA